MPRTPRLRAAFGAALLSLALPALAGPIGYSAWDVSGTDKLVRFDMATGVGTVVGLIQNAGATEGYSDVDGLAFDASGQLWAVNDTDNALLRIDAATGTTVEVGSLGSGINDMGLAFVGGTLYMSAANGADTLGSLYRVDTTTGAATKVGDFAGGLKLRSLGTRNGTLFGWSNVDTLVSIDTLTAGFTTIGSLNFSAPTGGRDGMDVDPSTGTIWGLGDAETRTYTIDASTGVASVVAQQRTCIEGGLANAGCTGGGFNGLAIQAVPEPASFGLAGLALLGLAGQRRRRAPR